MSDLEEMGYILQPHTSAGRIPSDMGYRYYVDELIQEKDREIAEVKDLIEHADRIIAVRGNCEAEVDQMVLDFPCMATYNELYDPSTGHTLFLTHGHIYGPGLHNSVHTLPALCAGDTLVYGHTHIKVHETSAELNDVRYFNPGSVGIPKDGSASYGLYEDGHFEHCLLG